MTMHNEELTATAAPDDAVSRREAISAAAGKSSALLTALGIGAVPVALAALSRSASAQTTNDLLDGLQFVLLIAQMQDELHLRAASVPGFVPASDTSVIAGLRVQDSGQEQAIGSLITSVGATPADKPAFDWTAKGAFPGFSFASGQYATYLMIAQGLEDLGVRAFKGQIARMTSNTTAMSQIASYGSIQGRHAAEVRRVRGKKAWITSNSRDDLPAIFQPVYDGEEVTVHAGYDAAALSANGGLNAVTEAFDEPLTKAQASVVVAKFLA